MDRHTFLVFALLGIALLSASPVCADDAFQASQPQCDPPVYYGIQHCVEAGGLAHTIIVDPNDPHVRFRAVLPVNAEGKECNSVNASLYDSSSNCSYPYPFERISSMLQRHIAAGAVAIINTDYFGCGGDYPCGSQAGDHGPQGLTVRDGERLDGVQHGVTNPIATREPSLSISPSNVMRIGRPESAPAIDAHLSSLYFNTVSGAPIIVADGRVPLDVANGACGRDPTEDYPVLGACSRESQSAAALINDGRLVLITARMNAQTLGKHLIAQHAAQAALKFDGGGSARMAWLDDEGVIQQFGATTENRSVAGGLLVFSTRITEALEKPVLPTAPAVPAAIDGFGMGSGTHLRVTSDELEGALDELKAWNVGWTREEIPWAEVEPVADAFRWEYFPEDRSTNPTALFPGLKSRAIRPVIILDYGPAYLAGPVPDDQLVARWRNYVQQVVAQFGKDVDYWEIGNEMNSRQFWGKVVYPDKEYYLTLPNPDVYARMLRAAYEVIKAHDPRDTVVLGGLIDLTDGDCETSPYEYLRRLHAAGAWDVFDVIAVHPYWGADPPEAFVQRGRRHDPDTGVCLADQTATYSLVGEVRAIRDLAARFGSKPIWVTEVGWDRAATEMWAGYRNTEPEVIEADYLARTYVPLLAEPGVEKVFWYTQRDDSDKPAFALRAAGQRTLTNLSELLTGSRPLGQFQGQQDRGSAQDDDVYEYRFDWGGQLVVVAWKARGGDTPRQVVIRDLDVSSLRMYPVDTPDLAEDAGQELVVTDGKITIALTEHPVLLVSEELSWWAGLWRGVSGRVEDWWRELNTKVSDWWEQRQIDLVGQLERWWQEQWAKVQRQIDEWLRELEQQAAERLQREIEEYFNSLCGTSLLPAGFAVAVWIGFSGLKKRR